VDMLPQMGTHRHRLWFQASAKAQICSLQPLLQLQLLRAREDPAAQQRPSHSHWQVPQLKKCPLEHVFSRAHLHPQTG
jgi:hypothetical protein